jgi:hypothetical protein
MNGLIGNEASPIGYIHPTSNGYIYNTILIYYDKIESEMNWWEGKMGGLSHENLQLRAVTFLLSHL